ncbi:HNH endonuclease [Nitrosomonas communis]|uniref:HNH endonuclease n=1 Tax=Nitrosomonas communis TaxID=44574 RepID=UPI003D2A95F5
MPIQRLSGRKRQEARARIFRVNPLCVECWKAGRVKQAEELDHIVPLHKGGTNDDENLQGLCQKCHSEKSAMERGFSPKREIGVDGFPVE